MKRKTNRMKLKRKKKRSGIKPPKGNRIRESGKTETIRAKRKRENAT